MGHNRAPLSPSCMDCGCPYSLFRDFLTCADYIKEADRD